MRTVRGMKAKLKKKKKKSKTNSIKQKDSADIKLMMRKNLPNFKISNLVLKRRWNNDRILDLT